MSMLQDNPYHASLSGHGQAVAWAEEWERTVFIRRTYSHLAGAIAAFALIEAAVFNLVPAETLARSIGFLVSGWNWLFVLGAFAVVSWIANSWAVSTTSLSKQYVGLALYVVAEALIFVPLLFVSSRLGDHVIPAAGVMTGVIFAGLTGMTFATRADFSWLGRWLCLATLGALGFIVCAMLFGFNLGTLFAAVMIVVASGYILYDTSNVIHHYRTDQYVAASLALFASVALLFWYVLRIVSAFSSRD
ncbi:MAG: Bax inhibitor-1 family protein [Pirellulaceae bacterium]